MSLVPKNFNTQFRRLALTTSLVISVLATFARSPTLAQITPDTTLGSENSVITPNVQIQGASADQIEGGARRGGNLFHSFSEFNVGNSQRVFFASPDGVTNILSRVTGNNLSNIQGVLGVNGKANLFLLNPNGIIFGPNAQLSVQGSFLATTADSFIFRNGLEFSVTKPEPPPLLIVNLPVGLQFGASKGSIRNQSSFIDSSGFIKGLEVPAGKTLALVGGPVLIEGGFLTAPEGRIELGSVGDNSFVSLNQAEKGWVLDYERVRKFQDIELRPRAINFEGLEFLYLPVVIAEGGDIQIQSRSLVLTDGSQIQTNSFQGSTAGGDLTINASESVELIGSSSLQIPSYPFVIVTPSALFSGTTNDSNAGNIQINTKRLIVRGGIISAESASEVTNDGEVIPATGNSGNLIINASESVELNGDGSQLVTQTSGPGKAGDIIIKTNKLTLREGGFIRTGTNSSGDAGSINITANEFVKLSNDETGLLAETNGSGIGGDINIFTPLLNIENGAVIDASANIVKDRKENNIGDIKIGNAGDISIKTDKLFLSEGGKINVSTNSSGDAGKIFIQANKLVNLSGSESGLFSNTQGSGTGGDIFVQTNRFEISDNATVDVSTIADGIGGKILIESSSFVASDAGQIRSTTKGSKSAGDITLKVLDSITLDGNNSGLFANATPDSTGPGGNIKIDPKVMYIQNGAKISVNSQGTNSAGNIELRAGNLTLDRGTISATSTSGKGGDIDLNIDNLLLLKNNSNISASAGDLSTNGDGGNITINTDLLVALGNSDIKADAFTGEGGTITITARGLFLSPDSEISASSELGVDGVVEINNRETDPINSVTELPEVVEPPQEVAKGCRPGQALGNSTFVNVGRGGLPPGPQEAQTASAVWQDLRAHHQPNQTPPASTTETDSTSLVPDPPSAAILEAQGWTKDDQGRIYLTTTVPQPAQSALQPTAAC